MQGPDDRTYGAGRDDYASSSDRGSEGSTRQAQPRRVHPDGLNDSASDDVVRSLAGNELILVIGHGTYGPCCLDVRVGRDALWQ